MGYVSGEDFDWSASWALTDRLGITHGEYNAKTNKSFQRGDAALVSACALKAACKNGKTLYYHIMENSIGGIPLQGISLDEVESIRLISDGTEIKPLKNWIVENYPDVVFVQVSNTVKLPDDIDTVIAVHTK